MKSNNKGFTLVELIVVMAIIAIFTAIVGLSISTLNSAKAERCAASVNSLISKCRADSLGRTGSSYLTISLDDKGNIVCEHSDGANVSTDAFPASGVSVLFTTTSTYALTTANSLTLSFDRSTGAQNSPSYTAITFTSGRTYTITLVPSTGYHKLT